MEISNELREKYDSFYSGNTEEWRRLGAIGKVKNIRDVTQGYQFDRIIDVGAGDGNVMELLSNENFAKEYTAAEISESGIERMKMKNIKDLVQITKFDGYSLPFPDKSFDLAICSHVIEHVEFPRKILAEIKRVSKMQVFEVPIDFSFSVDKKFSHFNSYGHINIYTPALFNFLLYTLGFSVVERKYALYSRQVVNFQFSKTPLKHFIVKTKRLIWRIFPLLMKYRPNTYTVLTR